MTDQMNLKVWVKKWQDGDFSDPTVASKSKAAIEAGWYDWFCSDNALFKKTQKLGKIVERISKSDKINPETMYVFFKNNCPVYGPTYDSLSICDIKTGDVLFWVSPKCTHVKGKAVVDEFTNKVVGNIKDVYNFFGV